MSKESFFEVIPIKIFRANAGILTYSSKLPLIPGQIVQVPLGKSSTLGIVLRRVTSVEFSTKPITRLLYAEPLPRHILKAIFWLHDYYLTPLPLATNLFLPPGIDKKRRQKLPTTAYFRPTKTTVELNSHQKQALEALKQAKSHTKLLHGITGSGKTNIYLKLALDVFRAQKSTILLVPEIALTSQLVQIFEQTFGSAVVLVHSRQTEAERHLLWEKILKSTTPQVIIGPRSALLAPVSNLELIIIDEAHESSYFQEQNPKYSALRLASFFASSLDIDCVLGTATPNVADYYLAKQHNSLITLSQKAKSTAFSPDIKIIDLKNRALFNKNRYFSDPLLRDIEKNLANHHQTLIFHNRRGSAPLTICDSCGWQALCPNCFLPLSLHSDHFKLICHSCGFSGGVPSACPSCHHPGIIHKGFGTKLLENQLQKLFKTAKIARFDADNSKKDSLDTLYQSVKSGDFDIIVGTQTVVKGLDLPLLATVGVVQADSSLSLPDFTSEERTFELLTQVIGRVGRGHLDTASVFIQTYQPNHPAITLPTTANYDDFAQKLLENRRRSHLPPFSHLATLSVTFKTELTTIKKIRALHQQLRLSSSLIVSPPTPAFHERSPRGFTWQITIKSSSRRSLLSVLAKLEPSSALRITVDPPSLLS